MTLLERLRRRLRRAFIDAADFFGAIVGAGRDYAGGSRSEPRGYAGPRRFSDYTDLGTDYQGFDYGDYEYPGSMEDLPPGLEDRPNAPPPFSFGTEGGITIQPIPRQEGRGDLLAIPSADLTGFPKRQDAPRLEQIQRRIDVLKEGGITRTERTKIQQLREERQDIKGRAQPSPWRPRPQPRRRSR